MPGNSLGAEFERAAPLLSAAAAELAPFTARLAGVHTFGHREDATVWLDSAPFGTLPGLAWSVLAARTVRQAGELPDEALLERFFADWAVWDWRRPVELVPGVPEFAAWGSGTGPLTVLTATHPVRSCTEQVGVGLLDLLAEELYRGWELLTAAVPGELCAEAPMHRRHAAWAVLTVRQYDGEDFADTVGRVRGRLRALLGSLAEEAPRVHAWPRPFESGPPVTRYAIGLGPVPPDRERLAELAERWTRGLVGVSVEWAEGGAVPTLS